MGCRRNACNEVFSENKCKLTSEENLQKNDQIWYTACKLAERS